MISVSNAFRTAVESTSRQFTARFLIDGNVLDCDIDNVKCYKGSCGNELAIGSVYASYIEATLKRCDTVLRNKELTYQVGLMVNGSYEYVTMGKYTVLDPKESNGSITFTAVSTISMKANQIYNAPYTHMTDIMTRLQAIAGVSIDYSDFTIYPYSETTKHLPADGTFRECIGIAGCLLGGFVTETTSGDIIIKKYNSGETVSILPYRCSSLPEFDTPYWIDGVKIIVKEADSSSAEESFEHGTPMIIQKCEYMSEGLFDAMYPNIEGLHFDVGKVKIALGDPCIEPWDILAVTDLKNDVHNVPCFEIVHTFNGGFETEVTAQVGSTDVNSKNVKGALEKAVERLGGDVLAAAHAAAEAEDLADRAAASASAAAVSASNSESYAQASATSASNSESYAQASANSANASAQSASNSESSSQASANSANQAAASASRAEQEAIDANKYASSALNQLGVVQNVIGVLTWAEEHGSFTLTQDAAIQEGKVYFVYDTDGRDYVPVVDPQASALSTYYELKVDEAMESYIMAHLALTDRGLWILPSGMGSNTTPETDESQEDSDARQGANYKVLISSNGFYVYDEAGVDVTTVGENITFNSTRPQYIGNENAYIAYNPKFGGSLTIGGATINLSGKTLTKALADIEYQNDQTSKSLNDFKDLYEGFIVIDPDAPSIILGETSSNSKVEITNSAVNIYSNQKKSASADGQTFNAPEGKFENVIMKTSQDKGNLRWMARSNGHLSLKVVK